MNERKALEILEIGDLYDDQKIDCQVKQQFKKLRNCNTKKLPEKIEACKILTDGQKDQAEMFSDLVISAINDDKLDFLELLLKTIKNDDTFNYLNAEGTGGNIPLNFALGYTGYKHESRVKIISLLLKYGADPNTKDREGKSSLHCITNNMNGVFCHKVTELLLDYNADPNAKDNQGRTLLYYLCDDRINNYVEIVKLLLKKGANPDIQNEHGVFLLYKVFSEKRDSIVKLLLENGADPNTKDREGKPPLSFALRDRFWHESEVKVMNLLLEHGADPNIKDQSGRSLFYYIINSYNDAARYKAVELLLDKGVDPNIQDDRIRSEVWQG